MAQALLVVVVTTYSTWHLRTTYIESPQERRRLRKLAKAEDEPDEDDHGTESEGESDELGSQRRSWIPGVFERLICDEAQKIKDPTTRSNRALRLLGASKVLMLTGACEIRGPRLFLRFFNSNSI